MKWIALTLTVAGCTPAHYVPCPTIVHYSKDDQTALANELHANPHAQTIHWIGDYIGLRDQVRECIK